MNLPAFQFYPGDWLRNNVSGCSLAAQGLWLRMLILMHDSDRRGYLIMNGSPIPTQHIARKCGCDSVEQYETLLNELFSANVPGRTSEGVIFSRRMVKDEKERNQTSARVRNLRERKKGGKANEEKKEKCNADVTGVVTPKYEDEIEEVILDQKEKEGGAGGNEEPEPNTPEFLKEKIRNRSPYFYNLMKNFPLVDYEKTLTTWADSCCLNHFNDDQHYMNSFKKAITQEQDRQENKKGRKQNTSDQPPATQRQTSKILARLNDPKRKVD